MKKLLYTFPVVGLVFFLAACSAGNEEKTDDSQTAALYADLKKIYTLYTDSLSRLQVGDTIATQHADEIVTRFEAQLHKVYKRYPADLDMELSPAQNDTLWTLVQAYMKQRRRLVGYIHQEPDTLAMQQAVHDSLTVSADN